VKKKIFVRAPCLSQSGYGEQSRFALRALKSREDLFDIYVQPIPWGQTGWIWEDDDFRTWLDSRITQTQILLQQKQLNPDISLQITIPNEFEKICPVNIGYTAGIECDKVSPVWLQKGNEQVDKILVVSNHAKTSYETTHVKAKTQEGTEVDYKLETPVEVVWETTPRSEPENIEGLSLDYDFNFLMVSQFGPRKNFENSIKWWVEENIDQEIGLVVKTNTRNNSLTDRMHTENMLKTLLRDYPDKKCKIYLLHGDLSAGQMTGLYTNPKIKALVNIAHGEGFGLPIYEAAREALPVITIGWSGQTDYLVHDDKEYFTKVLHQLKPVQQEAIWQGVIETGSQWAFAVQGSYKMALRKLRKDYKEIKSTAEDLQTVLLDKFSEEKLFANFCSQFYNEKEEKELQEEIDSLLEDLV
jgi:glycosyltransferase involved in cell wall biosynthesis